MMIARIEIDGNFFEFDLHKPIDVSLPFTTDNNAASAWYVPPVKIEPVRTEQFVGDVNEGGSVNFNNIIFNPHGNGTHTESVGHISSSKESVNQTMKTFFFSSYVISVEPVNKSGDLVITKEQIMSLLKKPCQAVLIRTLPNEKGKRKRQYSNSNPPYLEVGVIDYLLEMGVDHLLIDLPSVDRESDEGVLAAHHRFWNYPENPQLHRTITEFIFVPDEVSDGFYLLNIQLSPFENDAAPSKPILYQPIKKS
jgi:kynurenine formamidase